MLEEGLRPQEHAQAEERCAAKVTPEDYPVPASTIPVSTIRVGDRIRGGDLGTLQGLANSIHALGVIKPVVVDQDRVLVAGQRALEASKIAGLLVVPAVTVSIKDELHRLQAELAENLQHLGLRDPLPIGQALARLKADHEELHPETKLGSAGGGRNGNGARRKTRSPNGGEPVPCFVDYAAAIFGVSRTWIKDHLQLVGEDFPEKSRQRIREAPPGKKRKVFRQELTRVRRAKQDQKDMPQAMPAADEAALKQQWATLVGQLQELLTAQTFAVTQLEALANDGAGNPDDLETLIVQVRELVQTLERAKESSSHE